jgi:hypothetical protein
MAPRSPRTPSSCTCARAKSRGRSQISAVAPHRADLPREREGGEGGAYPVPLSMTTAGRDKASMADAKAGLSSVSGGGGGNRDWAWSRRARGGPLRAAAGGGGGRRSPSRRASQRHHRATHPPPLATTCTRAPAEAEAATSSVSGPGGRRSFGRKGGISRGAFGGRWGSAGGETGERTAEGARGSSSAFLGSAGWICPGVRVDNASCVRRVVRACWSSGWYGGGVQDDGDTATDASAVVRVLSSAGPWRSPADRWVQI